MSNLCETRFRRALPLCATVLPFIFAVLLVAQENHYYGQGLTDFIIRDRTATQIIVQIISQILGALQIYSLHSGMELSARAWLVKRPVKLKTLGFWMALSNGLVDTSLSIPRMIVTACMAILVFVPGALWAGAMTPLVTPRSYLLSGGLQAPAYSSNTANLWDTEFQMVGLELWNKVQNCSSKGIVTNCPVPMLQGQLLNAIASASSSNATARRHAKTDKSIWTYVGRSYGVGSSIGQTTASASESTALSMNYTEYGYTAEVTCTFNASAQYKLSEIGWITCPDSTNDSWCPTDIYAYAASGYLPNSFNDGTQEGAGENYTVLANFGNTQSVLAWSARSIGGENYISLAANNGSYSKFNQTQCAAHFKPSAFTVYANLTSRFIEVTPVTTGGNASSLAPDPRVTTNAVNSVNLLGRMTSSLYTSTLGDALSHNLAMLSTSPTNDDILTSVQNAFVVALDDILGAYGVSQIVLANDTRNVPALLTTNDARIGKAVFSRIVLAMSTVFVVIQLLEIVRTRFWSKLPIFNIFDIKSAIVASSAATNKVADELRVNSGVLGKSATVWTGDDSSRDIASLGVIFLPPGSSNDMPCIESANPIGRVETRKEIPLEQLPRGVETSYDPYDQNRWSEPTSHLLR